LLTAVAQNCVAPDRRKAVKTQIDLIVRTAERELPEKSDRAMIAGAAACVTEMLDKPGSPAPPPSAFGQVAAVAAAQDTTTEKL
jgi:uncharacterized membrane protein